MMIRFRIPKGLKINDISRFYPVTSEAVCAILAFNYLSFTLTGAPYVCPRHYTHLCGGVLVHIFLRALRRDAGYLLQVRTLAGDHRHSQLLRGELI